MKILKEGFNPHKITQFYFSDDDEPKTTYFASNKDGTGYFVDVDEDDNILGHGDGELDMFDGSDSDVIRITQVPSKVLNILKRNF